MITLIHGDNQAKSRLKLIELVTAAKQLGTTVTTLNGASLTEGELESALGSTSLFATRHVLVIENLLAGVRSKHKTTLIEMAKQATSDIIIWENKTLTAAGAKQVLGAKVEAFPISSSVFTWLDQLGSSNSVSKKLATLHQALEQNDPQLCLALLARQVRLLIQVHTNTSVAMAPFALTKLRQQVRNFTLPQLLTMHAKLHQLDVEQKQSGKLVDVRQELELLTTDN